MAQATQPQVNEFVKVVDEFMQKYAKLISPETRAEVYSSGNPALVSDYESTVSKSRMLKNSIDTTVGVWNAFKREWGKVTDVTSMYIGDAVDWLKGLFGGGPDSVNGLGAIQIPAAAFVVAAIGASAALIISIDRIFVTLEANRIQRDNPGIPRSTAVSQAKGAIGLDLFGDVNRLAMIAGLAFVAYLYFGKK